MTSSLENKFAVVGIGGIFPEAGNVSDFWNNVVQKRVSIQHLPPDSLEREVFYRPEVRGRTDKGDKSYTDLLAPIDKLDFDPVKFRLPPAMAKHMDDNQKLSLLATSQALSDGGLESVNTERVCVFMGATMVGSLYADFVKRFNVEELQHALEKRQAVNGATTALDQALLREAKSDVLAKTFAVTEDSAPGCLPNIIAARIASAFDLHGHTFVVDAACASGLAAIICGVQQLRSGEADAVICGAADMPNRAEGRILFSGIGALSPDGSYPFDARANGFVIGQGGGVVIIKRLRDAVAAGNVIHAVITGYGQCSDGKGKAIAAPNEQWQAEAIRRACVMAGYPVDSIELIEAHGTSTQVGDVSEVAALKRCFSSLGATQRNYCGIGSVKSNIGHLKSAAGIAAFIKTVMALKHGVLPPTASFQRENPKLALENSPFYVLADARDWAKRAHPHRAGVNAFGFGGADYHIALEEYRAGDYAKLRTSDGDSTCTSEAREVTPPPASAGTTTANLQPSAIASASSSTEAGRVGHDGVAVAFFSADSYSSLLEQVEELSRAFSLPDARAAKQLMVHNSRANARAPHRIAMTLQGAEGLAENAALLGKVGFDTSAAAQLIIRGIHYSAATPVEAEQVALMFPGQGSQYPDMMLSLAPRFTAAQAVFTQGDALWEEMTGASITGIVSSASRGQDATEQLLRDTRHTHPTVMLASLAAYRLLEGAGLRAGAMVGHSLGEYVALVAAGALSLADGLTLMRARGEAFSALSGDAAGAMLALPIAESEATLLLRDAQSDLVIANLNAKNQTIVSGSVEGVDRLAEYCARHGVVARRLNVSHAFHSPLMRTAEEHFQVALNAVTLRRAHTRVIANSDNQYYERNPKEIRARLSTQITDPVRFAASIDRLYSDGYRVFVEVGPRSVLSSLTKDILADTTATVLASDSRKGDTTEAYARMICGLFAAGLAVDPSDWSRDNPFFPSSRDSTRPQDRAQLGVTTRSTKAERIVYSGVSVGLPGSFKDSFRDDNFEQLFEGRNLIERLTDAERQRLVDLRITKLVKSEQGASYATLEALDQVIQLAGKMGRLNLPRDYHIDEKDAANMSSAIAHAVAAGYEALRDAQIPLVHEYAQTAAGSVLPERWALPKEMQSSTGIIFANGFPMLDPIIAEVSRHLSYHLGDRVKQELFEFYDSLIQNVSHRESRKMLTDWFALNYGRLCGTPSASEIYSFNHQLMTQIAMQANNRLAKAINARGPNFQLNAACSSAATAVMLAEEMIRGGRARCVLVIGADDPSSEHSLPYLGAGFLSTGACTSEGDLYSAAIPFDKRRNGMIMGAGAVGIVVEAAEQCQRRGVAPVCELLGTHCFNTASHGSQLDVPRYAEELEQFVSRLETEHGLARHDLASRMVYMSHETYTPARGGCSEAEAVALRHVFGDNFTDIEVSNIKGMTGHTMGASIEDAAAAKALQYGRVPPVVNHRVVDPNLEGLKLSKGGARQVDFALRMAAGFGSQGNFLMLSKAANGNTRIVDESRYAQWLNHVSGLKSAELTDRGRQLVIKDTRPGSIITSRPKVASARSPHLPSRIAEAKVPSFSSSEAPSTSQQPLRVAATSSTHAPPAGSAKPAPAVEGIVRAHTADVVLEIIAEVTGYSTDLLKLDMELEADLGIDTVKQATVLAMLGARFGLSRDLEFKISDFSTIGDMVQLFSTANASNVSASANPVPDVASKYHGSTQAGSEATLENHIADGTSPAGSQAARPRLQSRSGNQKSEGATDVTGSPETMLSRVCAIIGACSPYPADMLEPDLTLTSDLGLGHDAIAKIQGELRNAFALPEAYDVAVDARISDIVDGIASARGPADPGETTQPRLARQVLELRPTPLATPMADLTGKLAWLWGDDPASIRTLQTGMEKRGIRTQILEFPPSGSIEELTVALDRLLSQGAADFIVDTTGSPSHKGLDARDSGLIERDLARVGDCRFAAWKRIRDEQCVPRRALAITCIDGRCGTGERDDSQRGPLYGFLQGFYRTLRKELRDCRISILDTQVSEWQSDAAPIVDIVTAELGTESEGVDVCYVERRRHRLTLKDIPRTHGTRPLGLDPDEVALVTGGGAGITAALVVALGRLRPASFALVGRTVLDDAARRFHLLSSEERRTEKKRIAASLAQTHARVTPIMIDRAFRELERAEEILTTIEELTSSGCRVEYHSADVTDLCRMRDIVGSVRKTLGPITTIIHGAGVEISRGIAQKTVEEFHRVHSIKTLGAYHLELLCKQDPLRRVVVMSSISGLLGSEGQLDYSAANAFLDQWARSLGQGNQTRAKSLVWSGWAQRGMAARSAFLEKNADAIGINLINPNDGVRAALDEIFDDAGPSTVVLHRGISGLLDPAMSPHTPRIAPMVDWVSVHDDDRRVVHRRFSPARDVFLDQHRIAGTPLMPGVGFMEWMAEVCATLQPEASGAYVYRGLEFSDAFKLYRNEPRDVELHVTSANAPGRYDMQVVAAFGGRLAGAGDTRTYCRAQVSIEHGLDLTREARGWALGDLEETSYRDELGHAHEFGQNVNLGALFNDARHPAHEARGVDIEWGPLGIVTNVPLPRAQLEEPRYPLLHYLINPAFLDAMHQAGAVLAIKLTGQVYLPVAAREFVVLFAPKQALVYRVVARLKNRTPEVFLYDIAMWKDEQSLCALARDVSFRRIGQ